MISVVIPTHESERELVHTLAALVPGALDGIVREVIVVDAGSQDETARVADVAGCRFIVQPGGARGARLAAAAVTARADWLWFLPPGGVPEPGFIEAIQGFMRDSDRAGRVHARAAVLRRRPLPGLGGALALTVAAFARPKPEQGLLIARTLYRSLGGHDTASPHPEAALIRKLGRRRIIVLDCAMLWRGA